MTLSSSQMALLKAFAMATINRRGTLAQCVQGSIDCLDNTHCHLSWNCGEV